MGSAEARVTEEPTPTLLVDVVENLRKEETFDEEKKVDEEERMEAALRKFCLLIDLLFSPLRELIDTPGKSLCLALYTKLVGTEGPLRMSC